MLSQRSSTSTKGHADGRIPLCLVTGFLGSGKTTFLQHLVDRNRGRRVAYLVNEFSPVDVDGSRLDLDDDELFTVSGGSIFCRCKVTEFLGALRKIRDLPESTRVEGVVVEASGIADPRVVAEMLAETALDDSYELSRVICIVDPDTLPKLLTTLPNVKAQIESADDVIINKIDLRSDRSVKEAEHQVRRLCETASIHRSSFCRIPVDVFSTRSRSELRGEYAKCVDPNYTSASVELESPLDWDRLKETLDGMTDMLYRVKGYVPASNGRLYVDYSPAGWHTEQVASRRDRNGLVLIARGETGERLKELVAQLNRGVYSA